MKTEDWVGRFCFKCESHAKGIVNHRDRLIYAFTCEKYDKLEEGYSRKKTCTQLKLDVRYNLTFKPPVKCPYYLEYLMIVEKEQEQQNER